MNDGLKYNASKAVGRSKTIWQTAVASKKKKSIKLVNQSKY
jgi:hypothetical protein